MQGKSRLFWRLSVIAMVVFFVGAGIWFLIASTSDSKQLEQQVIDRFGPAEQYAPPADGILTPTQIERFILVRQAVQPGCAAYREVLDGIVELAAIKTDETISGGEAASRGLRGFKSVFKAGPRMLQLIDARNSALLEQEMGMGEYMYLYLAAYAEQLAMADTTAYAETDEAYISPRTRQEYMQILRNQVANAESIGHDKTAHELRLEIESMENGVHSSPWPAGPPSGIRQSLSPYVEQIAELYCEGIVAIELQQKNKGFNLGG